MEANRSASTACWPSSRPRRSCSGPHGGARQAGYREMDAYTPFPVEGLAEALGFRQHATAARRSSWAG